MKRLILCVLTAVAAAGLALSQEKIEQRRPAASDARISVENIAGSVIVSGWNREEVEVSGTLGAGTEGLEFTGERDRLTIKVKLPQNDRHNHVEGSNLTVHVPQGSRLSVGTISARIELSEFEGDADFQAISGDVRVGGTPRSVDVSTVSGPITFAGGGQLGSGYFKTVSGDIEAEADLSTNGRFKFETVSGDVLIKVPGKISADFDVSSFSGAIENDFGQTPTRTSPYVPSSELKFSVGGGGARVSVQTLSGRVRLKQS